MKIESDLLGAIEIDEKELIHFAPGAMLGFPECTRFVLVPAEREGLYWLQSAQHATLIFLLVDPFAHFPDYAVELAAEERTELEVTDESEVAILTVVTLPRTREERPTTNLQGPIVFNLTARKARQLAISDREWGMRRELDLSAAQPT